MGSNPGYLLKIFLLYIHYPNPHSKTLSHLTYDMRHCWSQGPAGECSIITHARGTQYSALTLPAATACNVPSFQGHSKPSQTKLCQAMPNYGPGLPKMLRNHLSQWMLSILNSLVLMYPYGSFGVPLVPSPKKSWYIGRIIQIHKICGEKKRCILLHSKIH